MDKNVGADLCVCPADHRANTPVRPYLLACANCTGVLGQIERAKDLLRWPEKGTPSGTTVLLVLAILLLGALAVRLTRRLFRQAKEPGPALALFAELVRAHALSAEEEKRLRLLSRREKLSNPARLFVERRYIERCIQSDPDGGWRELHAKLFGP